MVVMWAEMADITGTTSQGKAPRARAGKARHGETVTKKKSILSLPVHAIAPNFMVDCKWRSQSNKETKFCVW